MISTQFSLPILAVSATLTALVTGADVATDILSPPIIEGFGSYDAPAVAGEMGMVNWFITKRTACPGYASRVWTGQDGFFLSEPVQATAIPIGVAREYKIPTAFPSMAPAGQLELMIKGHFECEVQPREYFSLGPVVFEVVRPDVGAGR